jgi:lipopolysaccharide/colanic/teichoic acid biosynthesis glycosyltransferase
MILRKWEELPESMRTEATWEYYNILRHKKCALFFKRIFDIVVSFVMLIILLPIFIVLAVAIKIDSKGPVFYRQVRVTQYGKKFRIFKFRTMVQNADKIGSQLTVNNDSRITRVGRFIRKYRLDEICQIIDVLRGTMTFVGTRPEVSKYVEQYSPVMMATLLLPAGVTNEACIYFKDEAELLNNADDIDKIYVEKVLPSKMYYNLKAIEHFSFWHDVEVMFMTAFAILGKEYKGEYLPKTEKDEKEVQNV